MLVGWTYITVVPCYQALVGNHLGPNIARQNTDKTLN